MQIGILFAQFLVFIVATLCATVRGVQEFRCVEGQTLNITNATSQIITRKEGDQYYSDNLNCRWFIQAPEGKRIQVSVLSTDLQYAPTGSNCHGYDYVGVREGIPVEDEFPDYGANDDDSFQWCGHENPETFSSRDRDLFIEFVSTDRNIYDERGVTLEIKFFSEHVCPPGWIEDDSLVDDQPQHCYKLRTHKETWQKAQDYCRLEYANLVSFVDDREADFITQWLQSRDDVDSRETVWIGLNDIREEGQYVWIDNVDTTVRHRWEDSPHESVEYDNCVSMIKYNGEWKEQYCSEASIKSLDTNKFICKTNKYGLTELFDVPADRVEKEGKGSDVPIIAIILSICVAIGIIVIIVLCCIYHKRKAAANARRSAKRPNISYTDIPMNQQPSAMASNETTDRPMPSAPAHPPTYDEAINS